MIQFLSFFLGSRNKMNVFLEGHRVQNTPLVATSDPTGRFRPKGRKKYAILYKLHIKPKLAKI